MTMETETLMIVGRAKAVLAWCPDCRVEVTMIVVDDGQAQPFATGRIRQWLDAGKLHSRQLIKGPVQICVPSLLQCFEQETKAKTEAT